MLINILHRTNKNIYYPSSCYEAESKMDFIHKLNVALKEANETRYWLMLLKGAEYISVSAYESIEEDCNELIRLLVSIIKTSRQNLPK